MDVRESQEPRFVAGNMGGLWATAGLKETGSEECFGRDSGHSFVSIPCESLQIK